MWFAFSFVIAKFKHKVLVLWCIVYSIFYIKFYIDISSHEESYSKRRNFLNIRSHVLQIDFTLYLKSINHRISIRSFLHSSHQCMILSRRKNLLENFKQRIVERITSLKKFARKFQIEFVKILNKKHKRLLWKSVESTVFANVFDKCCNQNSIVWIDQLKLTSWHSHIFCVSTACMLQEQRNFKAMNNSHS